jgi:predicted N-acetyltransferase YhbS
MIAQIRPESIEAHDSIRRLNELAFGGAMEAKLVDALRKGGHVAVSLVAGSPAC